MAQVEGVSLVFDGLRILAVGGVFKIFFWDLFLKDYFDSAVEMHKRTVECTKNTNQD